MDEIAGDAASRSTDPMVLLWSGVWVLGCCGATVMLAGPVAAVDVVRVCDGELVISRRAGPLARTWRHHTGALRNLRIDMTPWPGDGADGAEHRVLLARRWGAVRVDRGAATVHPAPRAGAADAAEVLNWLRRRSPPSASTPDLRSRKTFTARPVLAP